MIVNPIVILAQTSQTIAKTALESEIVPIDWIWTQIISLNLLEAITFISFGIVCLLYGWRVFKVLVVISFGLLGLFAGVVISDKVIGGDHQILSGLIGLVLMIAISIPLMRWAVSVLGAIAGGVLTSGVWYACGLPEQYIWAGGLVGVVAGGMISFIVFKIAVMLFSSLGGSGLIVTGSMALLYLYPQTTEQVQNLVINEKWFLPVALMIPTAIGILLQQKRLKGAKDWSV